MTHSFASTLPKPHVPTLQPTLCQRACKANPLSEIELFKKFAVTKKKIKLTHEPTVKKVSKMTMTEKINNDNGLQGWKTEHQAVTGGIFYFRVSGYLSVSASNKLSCNLTGQCFEIGNKNTPPISYAQAKCTL